jgi:hypothetical protein
VLEFVLVRRSRCLTFLVATAMDLCDCGCGRSARFGSQLCQSLTSQPVRMLNVVLSLPALVGEDFRSLDAILFSILIFCVDANLQ